MKNLEKVADRIKKAVKNSEKIILYGDSDMDGISSTVILEEANTQWATYIGQQMLQAAMQP